MISMILGILLYAGVYTALEAPQTRSRGPLAVPGTARIQSMECYVSGRKIIKAEANELPGGEADVFDAAFGTEIDAPKLNTMVEMIEHWAHEQDDRGIEADWVERCVL